MSRSIKVWLALALAVLFVVSLLTGQKNPSPDFSAIGDITARKAAFIDYLTPAINEINQQRAQERQQLESILNDLLAGKTPGYWQRYKLSRWADRYKLEFDVNNLSSVAKELRLHLDQIPVSMVLAQAALESAWGTSRFSREANNFFGHWCFTEGCGIEPNERAEGKKHEVKMFDNVEESLRIYFRNINSHPAYQSVRQIRATSREKGQSLSGLEMVAGLVKYSTRGHDYIEELRAIIRYNKFEIIEPDTESQSL